VTNIRSEEMSCFDVHFLFCEKKKQYCCQPFCFKTCLYIPMNCLSDVPRPSFSVHETKHRLLNVSYMLGNSRNIC